MLVTFIITNVFSQSITINKKDAEVWSISQTIKGRLNGFYATTGSLFINSTPIDFNVSLEDSSFSVPITIGEGMSTIVAEASSILSDTLHIELAYNIRPEIYAYAEVSGFDVTLKAQTIVNPAA